MQSVNSADQICRREDVVQHGAFGDAASISLLAAVKDAEDHEPVVCEAVLKHVGGIEDLQHELAIFLSPCNGASESRKLGQYPPPNSDLGVTPASHNLRSHRRRHWRCRRRLSAPSRGLPRHSACGLIPGSRTRGRAGFADERLRPLAADPSSRTGPAATEPSPVSCAAPLAACFGSERRLGVQPAGQRRKPWAMPSQFDARASLSRDLEPACGA